MEKIKRFFCSHKYFFCIFLFILLYEWIVAGRMQTWVVDDSVSAFYALDFSFGFLSRFLPGAFYNLLFPSFNEAHVSAFLTVLTVFFFLALSVYMEKLLLSAAPEHRKIYAVLIFLFLTGPATFSIYPQVFGLPEFFWLYCYVFFFFFLLCKPLRLFIIPLCAGTLLLHYSTILCCIPCFCILLLYQISLTEEKKEKRLLTFTFAASVAVSIAAFLYFVLTNRTNLKYPLDEFNRMMQARGAKDLYFLDSVFYGYFGKDQEEIYEIAARTPFYTVGQDEGNGLAHLMNYLVGYFIFAKDYLLKRNVQDSLLPYLTILPILWVVFRFCVSEIRDKTNGGLRRFVFFCIPALYVFSTIASCLLSMDYIKWFTFNFVPLFASFLYVLFREGDTVVSFLKKLRYGVTSPHCIAYCAVYALIVLHPYA